MSDKQIFGILLIVIAIILLLIFIDGNEEVIVRMQKIQSKLEKIEAFREKRIFNCNTSTPLNQLCDLERRAEILEFCCQCPLYQEKVQQDMQQKQPSSSTDFQKAIEKNINIYLKKCNEALKKRHYFPFF